MVTSNHGEDLFQHGHLGHGSIHYDTVILVPLLVLDPLVETRGQRNDQLVRSLDVAPTVLARAGIPPDELIFGQSLLPLMGLDDDPWQERDALSSTNLRAASIHSGDYKLILQRFGCDGEGHLPGKIHGRMLVKTCTELFDTSQDPDETRNLASQIPDRARSMEDLLLKWLDDRVRQTEEGGRQLIDERFMKVLKERGYWEGDDLDKTLRAMPTPRPAERAMKNRKKKK